jgi:dihydrofolate synthase/folylpolyglutamate synthase
MIGMARSVSIIALPVPGHACHDPVALAGQATALGATSALVANDIQHAFRVAADLPVADRMLIAGSLYLAGTALEANDEAPQ